jgi:HlyD family secretion protein
MKFIITLLAAIALAACSKADDGALTGYVEADLLYLAPQDAGVVKTLAVREGDRISAGDIVFTLDPVRASIAAEQAAATAEGAALRTGDDGAMAKQIAEAEAGYALAEKTFSRSRALVGSGAVTKEKYDIDAASLASAKARLEAARADRDAMIRDKDSAGAAASLAEKRLADLSVAAPAAGSIEQIYRRPGEFVAAGDPVVALLAPENIKLKFFAPEARLATLKTGGKVAFTCDGCASAASATISFIAREPQYTPPVIYSLKERAKLVFLVEARPDDPASLRPGLPVTIELQ